MRPALALSLLLAGPVGAVELTLPANARLTVERNTDPDRYLAPVTVFEDNVVGTVAVDGAIRRGAWRLQVQGLTPLQVIAPLRRQLEAAGFGIALDCAAEQCGGFDFRFATEVLPGPNMYVNIRDYHFVTALRPAGDAPEEAVTVLASTSANSAYVQVIQAGRASAETSVVPGDPVVTAEAPGDDAPRDFSGKLLAQGHLVLGGLDFGTGSAELGAGPFESLDRVASFLKARPALRVALVGHTDTVGALEVNIALSRQRARSVRQRLIDSYGVAAARLEAEGMGYLAPLASNLDAEGREANRRVEVVLLSAE
jgi:outer membrane protein OmpA-like peptidoglycan-associated protein